MAEYAILIDAFWPRWKLPGWMLAYGFAPAAVLALLFPTASKYPLLHFFTIHQFLFHALIIAYFVMRFRAGEVDTVYGGVWAEIGVLVLLAAVIYCVNAVSGTNFMFLMGPDGNPALTVFWDLTGGQGGSPYILILAAITILLAHLMYGLCQLAGRNGKKRNISRDKEKATNGGNVP